jgi:hypothetical protein
MTPNSPLKSPTFPWDEPELVVAESKSFEEFDRWMDGQLDQLVAQWAHTAAPNANRADRVARRFGR